MPGASETLPGPAEAFPGVSEELSGTTEAFTGANSDVSGMPGPLLGLLTPNPLATCRWVGGLL
ncbi:hypothetical protein GCM10028822_40500 [Hymenobacter terrigena]